MRPTSPCWWRAAVSGALLGIAAGHAAEIEIQLAGWNISPDNASIYVGDTVAWKAILPSKTESYTGEWNSSYLQTNQVFKYTFLKPGLYYYRSSRPEVENYVPGVIKVQEIAERRPAVSIISPIDGYFVSGVAVIVAALATPSDLAVVSFYADGQLLGTATNAPYQVEALFSISDGKAHQVQAAVTDAASRTEVSPPINIRCDGWQLFEPDRLPSGQFAFSFSATSGPFCLFWSADGRTWNPSHFGQWPGRSVFVDESSTNAVQRFYFMKECL